MAKINPYIGFNGKCAEAMNFYKQCLGGELTFMKVSETPAAAQCPESMQDHIMHSTLTSGTLVLMGTDMVRPEGYATGNNLAISVTCESEDEVNDLYAKLGEGGKILDPIKTQFWGGVFGVVSDKYDVCWMLNYQKN